MAESSFDTLLRWTAVALCAAAIPLAHAQPHAANVSFRPHGGSYAIDTLPRPAERLQSAPGFYQTAHTNDVERQGVKGVRGVKGAGARVGRHGSGRLIGAPAMRPAGFPYRPISQDARNVRRQQGNATYLRAGSIRDAVTRYNEERDTTHPVPRPPAPSSRPPDPSIYRN